MLYDFSLSQLKTKPGSMHICTYEFITTARNNVMNDEKSDLQSQRVLLKKIVTFLLIAKMFIFFFLNVDEKYQQFGVATTTYLLCNQKPNH